MDSTTEEIPAKRSRIGIRKETQIPQETMLVVLLWLDRFDLDGKQVTSRRLRSLVEKNRMPLRTVVEVKYEGEADLKDKKDNILSIHLQDPDDDEPPQLELQIETDADARKAASYLASCFVLRLSVYRHYEAPPKNVIIAAPALIHELSIQCCDFRGGQENTLSETLNGSTFQCLSICYSHNPAWQINDDLLESLRLRGCNEIQVCPWDHELRDGTEKFHVTEKGILRYCFALDDGFAVPETRVLRLAWANVTPTFFRKLVDASKNSRLTRDVKLCLERLPFDITDLDVGVAPSRGRKYDRIWNNLHTVRYDIPDHGNGMRLMIEFKSGTDDQEWEVTVRHGQKDQESFFGGSEDDESKFI